MTDRVNQVFDQGATFQLTMTWKDSAGTAIDLTGYRIRFQVRQSPTAAVTLLDFDSDSLASGMHIGALDSTGVISITLDPSVTSAFDFQGAEYDITATSPGGAVYRLVGGKASTSLAVTR